MKFNNIQKNRQNIFNHINKTIFQYKEEIVFFLLYFFFLCLIRMHIHILTEESNPTKFAKGDHLHYIKMAEDISLIFSGEIQAPFLYRPLAPFIAGILPFDLKINFSIIVFTSFFLTGIILYFTLRIFFSKYFSFIGILIFCSFEYVRPGTYSFFTQLFWNVYLSDALAFLFLMLCFYSIFKENTKLYSFSLFLGTFAKEIVLFTIPVFFFYNISKIKETERNYINTFISTSLKCLKIVFPSILIFFLIRFLFKPIHQLDYFQLLIDMSKRRIKYLTSNEEYTFIFGTWGYAQILLCLFNKKKEMIKGIKYFGIFIVLIYFQLLFTTDSERLLRAGFFPIVFLGVSGLKNIVEKRETFS